jgi:glycosyltransferase involved in cell wall biosynthesis
MVILHILAPGEVGGLERVVQALAAGHRAQGHRVCAALVIDPSRPEPPLLRSLSDRGIELFPILVGTRAYLAERAAIAALCDRLRPDVVHTHGYRPDVMDSGVARRRGIPTVTTVHGFTGGGSKNRLFEWVQRRAFRNFSGVIAVSEPLALTLRRAGVRSRALHVIRNAWDGGVTFADRETARRELGLAGDDLRIGWAGRLSPEKGPEVVLQALALLRDQPVSLSMLGDGAARARLQAQARSLGVAERVTWHGTVPDAARLFPAFDVFVLSSHTEGTPMVLFEAMAAGVPVVASEVGGVPDVLSSAHAWLVPPGNPRALADAVSGVLQQPAEGRRRVAAAGKRLASEFAVEPWLDRHEKLYRAVRR